MSQGIIGSGFALQVAEQQKEKHVNRRRRPAAVLIQVSYCYGIYSREFSSGFKMNFCRKERGTLKDDSAPSDSKKAKK